MTRHYVDAQATATAVEVGTGEIAVEDDTASFPVTVETEAFGEVEGTVALPLDEEGAVEWEPHMAFPGLEAGEELGRETRLGERASILAARTARRSPRGPLRLARLPWEPPPSRSQARWGRRRESRTRRSTRSASRRGRWPAPAASSWRSTNGLPASPPGSSSPWARRARRRTLATGEPTDGEDVKTTIDPDVQTAAVTALGDQYGGVAVIDAKTGDVRGVAGLAFSAPQPPGSTFKIITATAGLDAGVVELDDEFPVETSNSTIGREISNAHDSPCGGTFVRSFADSCNTVFAPLGVEVGTEKMVETAEAFGFNSEPSLAAPEVLGRARASPLKPGRDRKRRRPGRDLDRPGRGACDPALDGLGRADDRERRRPRARPRS